MLEFEEFIKIVSNRRNHGMETLEIAKDLGMQHKTICFVSNIAEILDLPIPENDGTSLAPVSGEIVCK